VQAKENCCDNTLLRAEENLKKKERQVQEAAKAMAEYQAKIDVVRERTAQLRALRLAKEAAERETAAARKPASVSKP